MVNGKDTLVGADIELAKAIGEKLGVKVEFSVMSFDNVLANVQSGKADIAIAGISVTDERKKVYDFFRQLLYVRKCSDCQKRQGK